MNWNIWIGLIIILILLVPITNCDFDLESDEERSELYDTSLLPTILNFTTPPATIPTTTKDYCHCDMEIYGPEDMEGVLKSPNYPGAHCGSGRCMYKILPHEDMIVLLNIQTSSFSAGTTLKFWNLFYVDGKEYTLYHSRYPDHKENANNFEGYKLYSTAKNVGFMVTFEPKRNRYSYKGFKMTFERTSNETDLDGCPPALVVVGENETIVTSDRNFTKSSGCSFYLQPAVRAAENELNEMYIEYKTEKGVYVSVRSYDDEGYFTRDEYYDRDNAKLVDASKVEVLVKRRSSKNGVYKLPIITAKLLKQSCSCPPKFINLSIAEPRAVIRSPGYPTLYCPGKYCQTIIQSPAYNKKDLKAPVPLLMVSTNCTLGESDTLRLSSVDSDRVIFRTTSREMKPPKFLRPIILSQQDLKVTFHADKTVLKRYFEMNITRVLVDHECICSNYNDKDSLDDSGSISIDIPAKCNIIHCHWKFSAERYYRSKFISIEFETTKPTLGKVYIITDTVTEEYDSHLLTRKRSITSSASPIEFTFSRFNSTALQNAKLNIMWKIVESCTCAAQEFRVEEGKSVVIASPNYPEMYCPNLICRHLIIAPEGWTGTHQLENLNSSGNIIYVVFRSDETMGGMGFHANIIAHKKPTTDTPSVTHWVFFITIPLSICAVGGVAVWYVLFRNNPRQVRFQSLNNPTISYASSEIGSQVSIAFNGVNDAISLVNHHQYQNQNQGFEAQFEDV